MSDIRDWRAWVTAGLIVLFFILAGSIEAHAATVSFSFTASDFATPGNVQPGDRRLIASEPVPAELVGLTCVFSVTATNGESVHVNNYVEIVTNGNATDVLGTEDAAFGVHVEDRTLELGSTVDVFNIIGQRAVGELPVGTSVDMTIGVTCQTDDTTTTTTGQTTSSSSSTTTTPTVTTTTTLPTPSTSTTTPATTTTVPTESTTTTRPPVVTIPYPSTSTIPPITTLPTLPFTGPTDHPLGLGASALAALTVGAWMLWAVRDRGRHEA